MVKYVLFDFDGTLVNTNDVIIASWQHTYKHYLGHEVPVEKITSCFGEPLLVTMAREFPGVDPQEAAHVYRTFQQENCHGLVRIFPGIAEMLEKLVEEGITLGIVTSRTRSSAEFYADMFDISKYFTDMVCCEDTDIHKPQPEPLLLGLEKLGASAEEAIMVGDSPFDIKCANNAGVKAVLVDWRVTADNIERVGDMHPDFVIESPDGIFDVLSDLK